MTYALHGYINFGYFYFSTAIVCAGRNNNNVVFHLQLRLYLLIVTTAHISGVEKNESARRARLPTTDVFTINLITGLTLCVFGYLDTYVSSSIHFATVRLWCAEGMLRTFVENHNIREVHFVFHNLRSKHLFSFWRSCANEWRFGPKNTIITCHASAALILRFATILSFYLFRLHGMCWATEESGLTPVINVYITSAPMRLNKIERRANGYQIPNHQRGECCKALCDGASQIVSRMTMT